MASSIAGKVAVGVTALIVGTGGGAYFSGALDEFVNATDDPPQAATIETSTQAPTTVADTVETTTSAPTTSAPTTTVPTTTVPTTTVPAPVEPEAEPEPAATEPAPVEVAAEPAPVAAPVGAVPVLNSIEFVLDETLPDICPDGELPHVTTGRFEDADGQAGGEAVYWEEQLIPVEMDSAAGIWTSTLCVAPGATWGFTIVDAAGNTSNYLQSIVP